MTFVLDFDFVLILSVRNRAVTEKSHSQNIKKQGQNFINLTIVFLFVD